MASELSLIYPTIDLFLYDLRDGLGDSQEAIDRKRETFWRRLPNGDRALVEKEEEKEGSFIELLPKKYQPLPDNKNGFYYPVKLNDTLALQIDYSANLQGSTQPCKIKTLAENKKFIISDRQGKPGTLGETWLIWGQLAEIDQNLEETAKQCYAVFSNEPWQSDLNNRSQFKQAELFEISPFSTPSLNSHPFNHIVICLFPANCSPQEVKTTIQTLYRELIKFFSYYHKIHWIYNQSSHVKKDLKNASRQIQETVKNLPDRVLQKSVDLQKLQQNLTSTLTLFSVYASSLSTLEEYKYAIAVNLDNYDKSLQRLNLTNPGKTSSLFEPFRDYAREKYQPQITTDYNSASASLTLLENTIKTIEGIIQLEQTKRDRHLNKTIFVVSAGIGTASASASSVANFAEDIMMNIHPPQQQPLTTGYLLQIYLFALLLSLFVGFISSVIMGLLMQFPWRK
ncbi:hypothetical protein [Spirulina sp. 06S082]|uniref:hypothetical protein n=1 Tax=Spirulina sp. 06S082 TaxID=3110248 RepID=UPI002B219D3D|nr:hypothetical protein [Spirulina sp. 06S082]MEA5467731.1 hypothetical protein [Spirulina sp. 06S082]